MIDTRVLHLWTGIRPRFRLSLPAIAAAAMLGAVPAHPASIAQAVLAEMDGTTLAIDQSFGSGPNDLRDILAESSDPRQKLTGSIGRFGDVGAEIEAVGGGGGSSFRELKVRAFVEAIDIFTNTFGSRVHVFSDFIIDGGLLDFVGDETSFAEYSVRLGVETPSSGDRLAFSSTGRIAFTQGLLQFTTSGADLGASFDSHGPLAGTATVPLSFHTADLGILEPGESLDLSYNLTIGVGVGPLADFMSAGFSDPFMLNGNPAMGALRFTVVSAAVPEPSALVFAGLGLLAVHGLRRRARARHMRSGIAAIAAIPILLLKAPTLSAADLSPNVTVVARGLDNPRGLAFGPEGDLYVAEAGTGGSALAVGICPDLQIGPPYGPYSNGNTARISRVDRQGNRTTVLGGLPSGQSKVPDWQGVASVAFIGQRLFALIQGGGCSYGAPDFPKSIIEVDRAAGTFKRIADLGAFRRAHPPAQDDDDLEPEGVFYAMHAVRNKLYVLDANSSALLEVHSGTGHVSRIADLTASIGHITPTALAEHGRLYIANLFEFPIVDGASGIYRLNDRGKPRMVVGGLTAVLGLAIDSRGRFYVLEAGNGRDSGFPDPGAGRIVRVDRSGRRRVIATGLTFPSAMVMGPNGRLYVSNRGFDTPPSGTGEIVSVSIASSGDEKEGPAAPSIAAETTTLRRKLP